MIYFNSSFRRPVWAREAMTKHLKNAFEKGDFTDAMDFVRKNPFMIDFFLDNHGNLMVAAVLYGRLDVVNELLERGSDPLVFNGYCKDGMNVFNVVQDPDQTACLERILEYTKEWQEPSSVKALECAIRVALEKAWNDGDFTRLDFYLKYRPDLINTAFTEGTALSCAHKNGDLDKVVEYMQNGADPWDGRTDPFRFDETESQERILDYIIDQTNVMQAGELWEGWK